MAAIKQPVDVLVFHHTDQTAGAAQAGVEYIFEDCEERIVTLYDVNYIKAYTQGPMVYTLIGTNGETMISPWEPGRIRCLLSGSEFPVKL